MIIKEAKRLGSVEEYYFSKKLKQIAQLRSEGKNIINLGIGSPDLPPSKATIEALYQTAKDEKSHGYQSYVGIPELRQGIANWYKRTYNVALNFSNEILPLIGSKEGIMHISMAFINEGDTVLVPNPGYPTYTSVSNLVGAKIQYYNLDENKDWAIDITHLKSLDLKSVKAIWINYPNMPTGAQADENTLKELIKLAKENEFLIINDNPYSLILNDKPTSIFNLEGAKEVCLELNSLSKSHNMAGWRIGWVCGGSDYINSILKVKSNMDSGMFLGLQKAAIEALKSGKEWHDEVNAIYRERRVLVCEIFDLLKCTYNPKQVGLFVWAKVPDEVESVEKFVDNILYKADVFITPGFIFGTNGGRYVRASLCGTKESCAEALERINKLSFNV